jgi:hypothetical protein
LSGRLQRGSVRHGRRRIGDECDVLDDTLTDARSVKATTTHRSPRRTRAASAARQHRQ